MCEIMLNLVDARQTIHGSVRPAVAEKFTAALSAEPDTLDELKVALTRFTAPEVAAEWLDGCASGFGKAPEGEGVAVIDLSARWVVSEVDDFRPGSLGCVEYDDGTAATDLWLHYAVPEDWAFSHDVARWRREAPGRREALRAERASDPREVLYGKLCRFLVEQLLGTGGSPDEKIPAIHARWLMTPREDLHGRSPRQVLLARREAIDRDLAHQADHWAKLGACPPGLERRSLAYRLGGFGTHENIVYYDLIRHLLAIGIDYLERHGGGGGGEEGVAEMIDHLRRCKQDWLHTPQEDLLLGHTPAQIIHRERARLPNIEPEHSHVLDDDCPLCQMLGDEGGPMFWYLDGCHMDEAFPFSFHETREAWENEQQEWEAIRLAYRESRTH